MSIHKEIHLEDEICADLTAAGWLCDASDAGRCDRTQALWVDDAVAWIKAIALLTERRAALVFAAITGKIAMRGIVLASRPLRSPKPCP